MKRHDGSFHFRYWTSKTDQYAKSYPKFSSGGGLNSGTQFSILPEFLVPKTGPKNHLYPPLHHQIRPR